MIKLNVIGDPISHSKSPDIHGKILDSLNIAYEYDKVLVKKGELNKYISNAIKNNITGFNLTMPHKVDIIPFLKEIDNNAKLFDSVNTVKIKNGELYGYNTDANGYIVSLNENNFKPNGKNIVILGAGGVSSTLAVKLSLLGAKNITILNRTLDNAKKICEKVNNIGETIDSDIKTIVSYDSIETQTIKKYSADCDLLVNATPLGMSGIDRDFEDLSFLNNLKKDVLISDLIYNPEKTNFLANAENNAYKIMNGYGMLIGQAILADEIYLGTNLNISELYTKLVKNY